MRLPFAIVLVGLSFGLAVGCGSVTSTSDGGGGSSGSGAGGSSARGGTSGGQGGSQGGGSGSGSGGDFGGSAGAAGGTTGAGGTGPGGGGSGGQGGDTVGSGGHGAGGHGAGGQAGGPGAGGTGGAAGAGAGGTGGVGCSDLAKRYADALPAAQRCGVNLPAQCQHLVSAELSPCLVGCMTYVNDPTALNAIKLLWTQAGCDSTVVLCPAIACLQPRNNACIAGDGGGAVCSNPN